MTLKPIDEVREKVQRMLDDHEEVIRMASASDDIYNMRYDLPDWIGKIPWMRKQIDSSGHDTLRGASRILSGYDFQVKIDPYSPLRGVSKDTYELIENFLKWQITSAFHRQGADGFEDLALTALKYGEIIADVNFLPWMKDTYNLFGKQEKRMEDAMRGGQFMVDIHHPADAIVEYSRFGPVARATRTIDRLENIIDRWGDKAKRLKNSVDDEMEWGTEWDYMDWEGRYVWVVPQERNSGYARPTEGILVLKEERVEKDFLNFVAKIGGTNTEMGRWKRVPFYHTQIETEQWQYINLFNSIRYSVKMAQAIAPQIGIKSANQDAIDYKYWDPVRMLELGPDDEIVPVPTPQMDQEFAQMAAELEAKGYQSTLSRVLLGESAPSGSAFSSINLQTKTSLKVLTPYKRLMEITLEQIANKIVDWLVFTKSELEMPGSRVKLRWNEIPRPIYFTVEIYEDEPLDKAQMLSQALMAVDRGVFSDVDAIEYAGYPDPQAMLKRIDAREIEKLAVQKEGQMIIAEIEQQAQAEQAGLGLLAQLSSNPAVLQMLQQMSAALAQAQQQDLQGGEEPPGQGTPETPGGPQGTGLEGDLVNPAAGGTPPAQYQPEAATREQSTGLDRSGGAVVT